MKKSPTTYPEFIRNLSLDLLREKDSFAMAKSFGENVLKFAKFDSALLIWPDYGTQLKAPLKMEHLGKKKKPGHHKVYSIRFHDQDDIFFRIEFYYESKRSLPAELKKHLHQGETIVKEAIAANEQRLKVEELDRFIWMRHLSAGISHELNTPMTTLLFYTSKLLKELPDSSLGTQIKTSINVIEKTLGQYKVLSGDGQFVDFETCSLKTVGNRIRKKLEAAFPDQSQWLEFHFSSEEVFVSAQIQDIENIVCVLVKNAIEAMDTGTENPSIKISLRSVRGKFQLTVSDNGGGIKPEHRPYIFAPSFSTKDVNQGSGLGLSLARAMAFLNEGTLRLNSLSKKTQFILELPLVEIEKQKNRKAV